MFVKRKTPIAKLFLYRHRFTIGYALLGVAYVLLLLALPFFAQEGLAESEMSSATSSYYLGKTGVFSGDVVDLPYRVLQKFSIAILGLTSYAIKLPSIIIGLCLGLLLILLLNRWFKNNVSILASCLVILSTPFLFLAGFGTPLIMLAFWPTLLLWLGSKIQGETHPKPSYVILFALAAILSLFTPFMAYFVGFCVVFVCLQPHLRFIIKSLPKVWLVLAGLLGVTAVVAIGISTYNNPDTLVRLLFMPDFSVGKFFANIASGISLLFSWHGNSESVFLSPLVSLPVFAMALIGLFSTTKGFFASRNSIASILIVFGLIITGFNSDAVFFLILPFAILITHGIKYLLSKWYDLFPENPYARVSALLPLTLLFGFMIIPQLLQYVYSYHYNPNLVNNYSLDLQIIRENIKDGVLLVPEEKQDFYQILENSTDIMVVSDPSGIVEDMAVIGKWIEKSANYQLSQIITSPRTNNSDIIYLYTYTENN